MRLKMENYPKFKLRLVPKGVKLILKKVKSILDL
jgi:hypothetical protein